MSKIKSVTLANDAYFCVGQTPGVVRFEEFEKPGQYRRVPWIRVHYEDGHTDELNVAFCDFISRSQDPTDG